MSQNISANMIAVSPELGIAVSDFLSSDGFSFLNSNQYTVFPGFCDVHVHLREPGFSYKETIASGSRAAARGGYTAVCAMPNLRPTPDCRTHLEEELALIRKDACIHVYPYGSITKGENGEALSEMKEMAADAIAFSDDGRGVQSEEMMRSAMRCAKECGKMIVAHCEVDALLHGGYIHAGAYAKAHGHKGICSESEWREIERDLRLAEETGCAFHVCHISTKESVELIRQAKRRGVDVTCETAPHYLLLDETGLREDGSFRMNPPLRAPEDRKALIEGLLDGTIDMIATDHAPHSADEKSKGLSGSAFGIVGIETAFPVLYTKLVKGGILSLEKLLQLLTVNPRERFHIPLGNDFAVWELENEYVIDPSEFLSMGKSTPFSGWRVQGRCMATVCDGKPVYWSPNDASGNR